MLGTLAALVLIAGAQAQHPPDAFPSPEDKQEIGEIFRLHKRYGNAVWPGFGVARIPLVLYDDKHEYLIGHPSPPEGWTKMKADLGIGKSLWSRPAKNPQGFAVKVGDIWCGSFSTYERMTQRLKLAKGFHVAAVLHEMFHAFQAKSAPGRFERALKVYAVESKYPTSNEDLAKDWNAEGSLLHSALMATEPSATPGLVREFLRHREQRRRRAQLTPELVEFEAELEWLEGLGKHVEVRIQEVAMADVKEPPLYFTGAPLFLGPNLLTLQRGLGLMKGDTRYYLTGMAQARILDRLTPGWKEKAMQTDARLEDLLPRPLG